jgi:hypothetical protein
MASAWCWVGLPNADIEDGNERLRRKGSLLCNLLPNKGFRMFIFCMHPRGAMWLLK